MFESVYHARFVRRDVEEIILRWFEQIGVEAVNDKSLTRRRATFWTPKRPITVGVKTRCLRFTTVAKSVTGRKHVLDATRRSTKASFRRFGKPLGGNHRFDTISFS